MYDICHLQFASDSHPCHDVFVTDSQRDKPRRSGCPIAESLDVIGDRWTLVVVRDLMFAKKSRFKDLLNGPDGITTNILTDRLRRLEASGVVERVPYQTAPVRYDYVLTDRGKDLFDILAALVAWGGEHVAGAKKLPAEAMAEMDPRR